MVMLFNGLKSKRWPNDDDDEKVIIVEGQMLFIFPTLETRQPEVYRVTRDFDLMVILLEARAKVGADKPATGKVLISADVSVKPAISIDVHGDISSILLMNEEIKPMTKAH